jgi:23S rRNA pseudouridine1911/1915/1917 synthase
MGPRHFEVDARGAGRRADVYLAEVLGISRRGAQALVEAGAVRIGNRRVRKGQVLALGDAVKVAPVPGEGVVAEPDLALPVLFADDLLVVVDKPAGMPTHPLRPGERGTAANALLARYPELAGVGSAREAGAVHRLDAGTSGLLCFARTSAAYEALRSAFREGRVEKEYLALCLGDPPESGGCDLPIGHPTPRAPRARVYADPRKARAHDALPARTQFRVSARYRGCALLSVTARTGRMHQVRVHLAHLGYPLCGDALYQGEAERARDPTGLEHPFLHASGLILPHPRDGRRMRFESPLPRDLRAVLAALPPALQ